jgi:hypothetical protein
MTNTLRTSKQKTHLQQTSRLFLNIFQPVRAKKKKNIDKSVEGILKNLDNAGLDGNINDPTKYSKLALKMLRLDKTPLANKWTGIPHSAILLVPPVAVGYAIGSFEGRKKYSERKSSLESNPLTPKEIYRSYEIMLKKLKKVNPDFSEETIDEKAKSFGQKLCDERNSSLNDNDTVSFKEIIEKYQDHNVQESEKVNDINNYEFTPQSGHRIT